jgi:hypothetical protein
VREVRPQIRLFREGAYMAHSSNDFEQASTRRRSTIFGEFVHLMATNKKWWLLPIIMCLTVLALLAFFAGTGAAPFIYTIF